VGLFLTWPSPSEVAIADVTAGGSVAEEWVGGDAGAGACARAVAASSVLCCTRCFACTSVVTSARCSTLYSDMGSTFVGCATWLRDLADELGKRGDTVLLTSRMA
jgi:hypothetical protein